MHEWVREQRITGTGGKDKTRAVGVLQRGGKVGVSVTESRRKKSLQAHVREHVEPGTEFPTDAVTSYESLNPEYVHQVADHAVEYVKGHVNANGLENSWSLLKRTRKGTYVSVEPVHRFRYLDEQAFNYNVRKDENDDGGRFKKVVKGCTGKRMTYSEVMGDPTSQ